MKVTRIVLTEKNLDITSKGISYNIKRILCETTGEYQMDDIVDGYIDFVDMEFYDSNFSSSPWRLGNSDGSPLCTRVNGSIHQYQDCIIPEDQCISFRFDQNIPLKFTILVDVSYSKTYIPMTREELITLIDILPPKEWNLIDVSNITDMNNLFNFFDTLVDISSISGWNVSNVTNMEGMFSNCGSLTDISSIWYWDTSNVTNMKNMFSGCRSLSNISVLFRLNTQNVTNMEAMFYECLSLSNLNSILSWNVARVTTMHQMFYGCIRLNASDLPSRWKLLKQ